jgi:hypothetical protein
VAEVHPLERQRRFTESVLVGPKKRVMVAVPFHPDDAWGAKPEHHVAGSVNGMGVRAVLEPLGEGFGFVLGPAWRRDCGVAVGDTVDVELHPEGPQRDDLAPDLRAALDANAAAAAFWNSIAQFYRNAYLRWIDATKRRPEVRAERIAEVVDLLAAGEKERPKA